jgi:hypothetical protein
MSEANKPADTTPPLHLCMNCRLWARRQGGVGWCDLRYPQERRGLRQNTETCREWEATIKRLIPLTQVTLHVV